MASYKVEFKRSALKDIEKLDKSIISQIFQKIESLALNPRPTQSLKLKGTENSYRLRIGKYRVVYQIDDRAKVVVVYGLGHRRDIYRDL